MNLHNIEFQKLVNATTAIEVYASLDTFKIIFHESYSDRAADIFYYFKRFKLMQTIFSKMAQREKALFYLFFQDVLLCDSYDAMCRFIEDFTYGKQTDTEIIDEYHTDYNINTAGNDDYIQQ